MKKLATIFLFLPLFISAQQNRVINFGVKAAGSSGGFVRQNLIWENFFGGVVQTTTQAPGDPGMPTFGWNTRSGPPSDYLYQYDNTSQSCCSYSVRQNTSVVSKSATSLRFLLLNTDPPVSSSTRSEITINTAFTQPTLMDRWYGLSFYLDSWVADVCCESILQWHDNGNSPDVCPPLSIQIDGGGNVILVTAIACSVQTYTLGTLATWNNTWKDVVIHVDWTTASTGTIQCWVDGVLKVTLGPQKTQSNGGNNMKLGVNSFGGFVSATQRQFYIANFRVGNSSATYADVAP